MRTRILSTLLVLLLSGAAGLLYGQAGSDTSKGSVSVEVSDSSGAIIQGANILLTGPTGTKKANSDVRGQAVFYGLVPGTYSVRVEFQGFRATEVKELTVNANQRSPIRLSMEPGAVTEVVQVSEKTVTVDTATTTTGGVITQDQFANIPLGRNISALFSLAPGVSDPGATSLGSSSPSISGATGLENQYIIDGINTTDQGFGSFGVWSNQYGSLGTGVNFDFVKEVQIKTGGFEAQYGQATGGVVNIVTDSGGNKIHGAAYAYGAPSWGEAGYLQVNDGFAVKRTSSPQTETWNRRSFDIGFNVGGPFKKDRFFWYGAFDPSLSGQDRLGPQNFGTRTLGFQDWQRRSYNWVGKLNFNITENHRLEATAFGDPSRDPSGVHRTLVRDDLDSASSNLYGTRNWAVKYSGVVGVNTLLSGGFANNHTYFNETAVKNIYAVSRDYTLPKPNSAYTATGGPGYLENTDGNNDQYNFMVTRNGNFLGGHQIDIGYGYNKVLYNAIHYYSGPNWTLPTSKGIPAADVGKTVYGASFYKYAAGRSVGGVVQTVPVYRQTRGNFSSPTIASHTEYQSAFVQDAWQINRYITAKLGLRWEQQWMDGNQDHYTFAGNWAPRLGFIIDPTGSRKTKLFANWGRFFEKVPNDLAVRSLSSESAYNNGYFYSLPPSQASLVPGITFSPYGTNPTIVQGGTKAEYQDEIVAGFEHEFGRGLVVTSRFINRSIKRIIEDIGGATVESSLAGADQNFVITNPSSSLDVFHNPVECTSGPACNPDTGYTYDSGAVGPDGKNDGFPDPRRVYKAWETTVEKRFGSNWSLGGNYRLAKLFGNYEGSFRNDNEQPDPNITSLFDFMWSPALADQFKVGPLPTDRLHIANVFGNYVFRKKLNVGLRWNAQTGSPLNKLLAHPVYANAGEIPVGGRGAFGRTPFQNYWDVRAAYDFKVKEASKLTLAIDMLNLFDRRTVVQIDQYFELDGAVPNTDFAKPLTTHRPFYARFSLRYQF